MKAIDLEAACPILPFAIIPRLLDDVNMNMLCITNMFLESSRLAVHKSTLKVKQTRLN